ncbi:hypothetical protein GCG21_03385 [Pseudactinotalea sp. HY160]|uniref:hypothetical protein n=1 Tax=Pseudactinotalea sp. HY160 TaxID=2654490 RepID=UPI00128C3AD4|nr:hypothetical protein [Pseudactinotalea sp. HY160]MPV49062.1 hypothetical protein [Pseudactinotalea sp. HY160]
MALTWRNPASGRGRGMIDTQLGPVGPELGTQSRRRPPRATGVLATLSLLSMLFVLAGASTATAASSDITSAGPLTTITITDDLNCAVNHAADTRPEWYEATACGTLVAVGGHLYGPASIPAGGSATGVAGYVAFTPVSQSGPTGSGSAASPYAVTTVVDLGDTGIRLTQTDSYVVGEETYRTDVSLASTNGRAYSAIVYRAGDCYLQDSDYGRGRIDSGGVPVCQARAGSNSPDRIEAFYPLTAGSNHIEAFYDDMWAAVGAMTNLPDTCVCTGEHDNAVAISWPVDLAASGTATTLSSLTIFSPLGATPVRFAKTADDDAVTVPDQATSGYTITMSNEGAVERTLTSITDTLPAGFAYDPGSTIGATTTDPAVSGQEITWTGTFTVPAATEAGPGTLTLHFGVTLPTVAGTYTNSVGGTGEGVTVIAADGTAPITITVAGEPTESPTETPTETESPTEPPTETESPTESPTGTETPTQSESPTESPTSTGGGSGTGGTEGTSTGASGTSSGTHASGTAGTSGTPMPDTGTSPDAALIAAGTLLLGGAAAMTLARVRRARSMGR